MIMTDEIIIKENIKNEFKFFKELGVGDFFKDSKGNFYMCITIPKSDTYFNAIEILTGHLNHFLDDTIVYPYKKVEIIVDRRKDE